MIAHRRGNYQLELATQLSDLERLAREWSCLYERCPSATPFQHPCWLIAWWQSFAPGSLHVVCVRRAGELVGCAPFYIETSPEGVRRVLPLGIATSDYLDVLIAPDEWAGAARVLSEYISARRDELGSWELCELRPESSAMQLPVPPGMIERRAECNTCPVLTIPSNVEDLKHVVPAHRAQALRTGWRRARALGDVHIEQATVETAAKWLAVLDELHRKRWEIDPAQGVTADRRVYELLLRSVPELLASGQCLLLVMLCNEAPAAAHLLFMGRRELLSYMTGYDPELKNLGAGALLLGHAIEHARIHDRDFHFLRGDEPYKYLWGAQPRPNWRRLFTAADERD